jgi:hypothetical protein
VADLASDNDDVEGSGLSRTFADSNQVPIEHGELASPTIEQE